MLIEFTVGNYCSFREPVTLSMVAAKLRSQIKSVDENNVFVQQGQPPLLTSAAIFGPNASGKSNLIAALALMRDFVLQSTEGTQPTGGIRVDPFRLNQRTAEQPSHFEAVFILDGQRYRYGFEATVREVVHEWLYTVPKRTEALLFERGPEGTKLGLSFQTEGRGLMKRTRSNALFLSVVAQFDGTTAQKVVNWFRRLGVASGLADMGMKFDTLKRMADGRDVEAIVGLVKRLDLGIVDVKAEEGTPEFPSVPAEMPEELQRALQIIIRFSNENSPAVKIKTAHKIYDDAGQVQGEVDFDLDANESAGTQKLFSMAGPLLDTLARGRVMVIDELDSRLHTVLTREIIKLFNSRETNPRHAQLIFTTQDTNLLDNSLFRHDQFWFVEKDSRGASRLYSLAEFKGVRNDLSLEPNYTQGRFGAIPYIQDLPAIIRESQADRGTQTE
jgi:hypothetical protein